MDSKRQVDLKQANQLFKCMQNKKIKRMKPLFPKSI